MEPSLFIIFRSISGIVIAGLLSYLIVKALDQTGVTKLFRPASQKTTKIKIKVLTKNLRLKY